MSLAIFDVDAVSVSLGVSSGVVFAVDVELVVLADQAGTFKVEGDDGMTGASVM
jgi:hypothetical protein